MTGKIQNYTLIFIILLGFYLVLSFPVLAQKDSLKVAKNDDSQIVPRSPDSKYIDEFRNDRDYQYNDDPAPPENPVAKWITWFLRKIGEFFSGNSYESFWQYVIMIMAAGLLVFLLYKAKILEYVFPSKGAASLNDYIVGQENIHEINFEDAIGNALSQRDFRLAIRLQYLKILKLLSAKELIHWKPSITNQTYIQELQKYPYQADFVKITRYFEFAWYGDFQINESEFEEMRNFTNSFQDKISG